MSESSSTTTGEPPCVLIPHSPEPPGPAGWAGSLLVWPTERDVAQHVAAELLAEMRAGSGRPLGLATGRTMEAVYAALVSRLAGLPPVERERLLAGWHSFNLDEYVGLGPEHPASFSAFMARHLVEPLGLDPARVRLPKGLAPDPAAEARRYASAVEAAGGIGLQLLGLGGNGHVGFNEPPCGAEVTCRCVTLCESTCGANASAFGGDPQAVPPQAITLGIKEILAASCILLVVTGANKAPILRRLLAEPPNPGLPASWLQMHPNVTVLADRAALGDMD